MLRDFNRAQRIARELKKEIAIILHRNIQDPRIKITTISDVEVSRDLAYAKIFVTFLHRLELEDKKYEKNVINNGIKVLNGNMSKHIRSLLSKVMQLRIIPKLTFIYDSSLAEGRRISNLVNRVIHNDKIRHVEVLRLR